MSRRLLLLLTGIALLVVPGTPTPVRADEGVLRHIVDRSRTFQTIDHFGASDCWTTRILAHWTEKEREQVADLLFSTERGIGLSLWRFNLGAGKQPERIRNPLRTTDSFEVEAGRYDWTRMPTERWMLQAAKSRGVSRFHAFALSPPPRMTRNGFTNCDPGAHSTNLEAGQEPAYATYLADILEHFARGYPEAERVAFDWISPFNEPQWDWNGGSHEATRWSNDDMRRVTQLLGRELQRRRLATRIHLCESGSIPDMTARNEKVSARYKKTFGNYLSAFCKDPEIAPFLGKTIGYHSYWSDGGGVFWKHRSDLHTALKSLPDWQVFQTEYCVMERGRDLGMDTALHVARVMHGDLSIVGTSGWSWWLALSPHDYKDGLLYTDWKKPGDAASLRTSKTFWGFGNYSRFVRPGMVRISIEGDGLQQYHSLVASAYRDATRGRLVVVYVNTARAPHRVRIDVQGEGKALTTQQIHLTAAGPDADLRPSAPTQVGVPVEIPGRSIVTVELR